MKINIILALMPIFLAECAAAGNPMPVCSPRQGAADVNPDTHLVLSFKQSPAVGEAGFIRVFDASDGKIVDSLDMSLPSGLTKSRTYGSECEYAKVPYDYSRTFVPTNRNTVPGTPSGTAEPTPRDMQLTIIGGFTDGFRFHPVIFHGDTAVIYLHNNVLELGHKYGVSVDASVFEAEGFEGIEEGRWTF